MTMLDSPASEVEDPEEGSSAEAPAGGEGAGELVLPEEVVAELAGRLAERARSGEPVALTGPGGLLSGVIGQVLQAGLAAELDAHLGGGDDDGNRRNGTGVKTLNTEVGPVRIAVPRDRAGTFEPQIVKKRQRRLTGVDEIVLSLYARGLTTGEISAHFAEIYGASVSKETVSRITDRVIEEMQAWQSRPLDADFQPAVPAAVAASVAV